MSSVSLSGNASGTGSVTIAAPNTNSTRTLTLPDATGTIIYGTQPTGALVGTTDTQTLTNKTLTTPNIDSAQIPTISGSAPLYMCRAWVNFNGTGTVAIRASGNVSSITDNGVGDYTVNFATAMPDANYSIVGQFGPTSSTLGLRTYSAGTYVAGSVRVETQIYTSVNTDFSITNVAIFR